MTHLVEEILKADAAQLESLLKAVIQRYKAVYPDWEVIAISLEKTSNLNEQIDGIITLLQNMKTQ